MFPRLAAADPRLGPVLTRLQLEHNVIHGVLEDLDQALVGFVGPRHDEGALSDALDGITVSIP